MTDWRIGMNVVCVDDDFEPRSPGDPVEKGVYEVRGFHINDWGHVMLRFSGFDDWSYRSDCFRPVVEREADIYELQAILDRVNKREPVHV